VFDGDFQDRSRFVRPQRQRKLTRKEKDLSDCQTSLDAATKKNPDQDVTLIRVYSR
jgi:hypothetical protein